MHLSWMEGLNKVGLVVKEHITLCNKKFYTPGKMDTASQVFTQALLKVTLLNTWKNKSDVNINISS